MGTLAAKPHNIFTETELRIYTYECERKERFRTKPMIKSNQYQVLDFEMLYSMLKFFSQTLNVQEL
jgi:hypothetical protein